MKRPAVFIDRDGTINEQMGYLNHISRFVLLGGVFDAVRLLNGNQFLAIVLSNQSGVARGYFPVDLVYEVHALMLKSFREQGAFIDEIFFCPHHPRGVVPEYTCECDCRKPKTGLIDQACQAFDIDLSHSYIVGDRYTDIELGHYVGIPGIIVKTGYGLGDLAYILPQRSLQPAYIAKDLLDAVTWILYKEKALEPQETR